MDAAGLAAYKSLDGAQRGIKLKTVQTEYGAIVSGRDSFSSQASWGERGVWQRWGKRKPPQMMRFSTLGGQISSCLLCGGGLGSGRDQGSRVGSKMMRGV